MNLPLVLAVVLTLACSGRSPLQEVQADVIVGEECPDVGSGSDHYFFGTGVVVGSDRVLTALHVAQCDGGKKPELVVFQGNDGGMQPARVEIALPRIDAARLIVPSGGLNWTPVSVAPRPVVGDADLTIVTAWPLWQVKHCVVQPNQDTGSDATGVTDLDPTEIRILVGCDIEPGNSGAAAYDSHGRLVGLVSWTGRASQIAGVIPLQSEPWITRAP